MSSDPFAKIAAHIRAVPAGERDSYIGTLISRFCEEWARESPEADGREVCWALDVLLSRVVAEARSAYYAEIFAGPVAGHA